MTTPPPILLLALLAITAQSATTLNVMHQREGKVMSLAWNSAKGEPIVLRKSVDGVNWITVCTNALNRASLVKLPGVNYLNVTNCAATIKLIVIDSRLIVRETQAAKAVTGETQENL